MPVRTNYAATDLAEILSSFREFSKFCEQENFPSRVMPANAGIQDATTLTEFRLATRQSRQAQAWPPRRVPLDTRYRGYDKAGFPERCALLRKFRLRGKNFACEGKALRSCARKPLKSLGQEIDDFAVSFVFKALRGVRLCAVFALRAAPPGAAFGDDFARDGETFETLLHLGSLVNGPVRGVSGASDMSGLGSTWFVRFLNREITCCRRFGWRVYWMRSSRIVRDD